MHSILVQWWSNPVLSWWKRHVWEVVHRNCENRFDFFKAPIIFSSIFYFVDFVLLLLVSFSFRWSRFVSFLLISLISFLFRFVLYRCPMIQKEYWCLIWNMNMQSASSIWSNLLSNATVNIIEIVHNCVRWG